MDLEQHHTSHSHSAKIVKQYLEENNIQVYPLPPYSLDINIIENLWSIVKERVSKKMFHDPSQDQVQVCQDAYHSIEKSIIKSLYESLPDRIDAILKAHIGTITDAGAAAGCADTGGSTAGGESGTSGTGGTGGTGGTSTSGSTGIIAGNSSDASEDSSKGSSDSRSSSAKLAQEDIQSENHNIKSEIIILQDKFSKESFNIGHDTLVGISEVSPSSHTDRGDRSINIGFSKKLIKSMKSNVGSSNAGANGSPIILLNTSEEINGDRIKEIEHESESYRIAKKNLAMEKDLETNLLPLKFSTLKESLLRDLKNRYNIATNERRKRKEKEKKKEKGGEKENIETDRDRDRNRDRDRERSKN
ncbi:hypothetical protein DICPUDRAFT_154906 [Dictyostelium purpureum]|uniref:Tc1-like transposase DDE domain-containing protein n=1 Tax=Dictyostelium purpureum TaxID=5786 RepID=F0ZSK2_DICPU|nr:uncharacterized protein DICPUDRAFT_154906 [Dictyostelium purpureum]EGC33081.1 hypothetical protein DICPUDRAFT_154906 [Dictyostelium purpureum]|eukprot:XP_003290394.1 hypothetical protein DICPUDRAFT_154906 [Dictyostelium purpureum]